MSPERWLSVCIDEGTQGKCPADPGRWDVFTAHRAPQRQSLRGRFGQGWRRCALGTLGGGRAARLGRDQVNPDAALTGVQCASGAAAFVTSLTSQRVLLGRGWPLPKRDSALSSCPQQPREGAPEGPRPTPHCRP